MVAVMLNARERRVFNSVFGDPTISQPTPVATPATDFTVPGRAFGGPPPRSLPLGASQNLQENESDTVRDQVRWDRSWHAVTHALYLPDIPTNSNPIKALETLANKITQPDQGFRESLKDILHPKERIPFAIHTESISIWYGKQAKNHFVRQIRPILAGVHGHHDPVALISRVVELMNCVCRLYMSKLDLLANEVRPGGTRIRTSFELELSAIISNSVPLKLEYALKSVVKRYTCINLGLPKTPTDTTLSPESIQSDQARQKLLGLIDSLKNVGLAGAQFEITFAEIMNDSMNDYVYLGCKGIWSDIDPRNEANSQSPQRQTHNILPRTAQHAAPSRCVINLCEWIENRYARLTVEVLGKLKIFKEDPLHIPWSQVEKWKEMGIGHLAALRSNELFDIVGNWPNSKAALDDLRTAITTPQRRLHLTDVFGAALKKKLLHPGASTLQILRTYISMISSFHYLDHSKVLLDRVAYPLQLYLCSREDTVRVIITGLLSDTEDAQGNPILPGGDKLLELALLLNNGEDQIGSRANDDELDWHDMDWMPDPVDAGPGYKRSKNADIIGTLIGALGSQDIFIKEFQSIIGENFLKQEGSFDKEIKLLELLKIRFGEAPLQSCEVMLKDIQDSGRVDASIRKAQKLDLSDAEVMAANELARQFAANSPHGILKNSEGLLKPTIHAKILSRMFWPQLHDESFRVPKVIADLQSAYETGFEVIKTSRKLTWLHALGQATVELEFTDRTIVEEVHTWQATVIWGFQNVGDDDTAQRRSVQELVQHLEMDETLVRSALKFWVNKIILQEVEKNVFEVLETLNQEDRARSNAQAAVAAAAAPEDSLDEAAFSSHGNITKENREIYWKFVEGMLKNASSQMPLQQIGMMLKMLVPDGFPHSNEELQELLGWKVGEGELEFAGGKYKLRK